MGTRNLTAVVKGGKYIVAQYGQFDGYPSGQGLTALTFVRDQIDRQLFAAKLDAVQHLTAEQYESEWAAFGYVESEWSTHEKAADQFFDKYPLLRRNVSASVLLEIQDGPPGQVLRNQLEFAADGLFCEWAYVVDLDKNTFEVFQSRGVRYEKEPYNFLGDERFAFLLEHAERADYPPVRLVVSFSLNDLPTNEQFLEASEPKYEEEE